MQGAENEQSGNGKDRDHDHGAVSVHPVDDGRRAAGGGTSVVYRLAEQTKAATALIEHMRILVGDDDEMIATAVEGETDVHEALWSAMKRLAELEMMADAIDDMLANLSGRKARFQRQHENIRQAIIVAMEAANLTRVENGLGTMSLKATPAKVEIVDETAIPSRFWKSKDPELDKRALLAALKGKDDIPGAVLSNGGQTIQVKFS